VYIEEDYENRKTEFQELIKNVDFKKIEKEKLISFSKKFKWLLDNTKYLNIIMEKEIKENKSELVSGSETESDNSKKSSESE
jgi:hypothetical protein